MSVDFGEIVFKDSLHFLQGSLSSLVQNLKDTAKSKAQEEKTSDMKQYKTMFPSLYEWFKSTYSSRMTMSNFEKILAKGEFPYLYFTSTDVFKEKRLPYRKYFYNDLTQRNITPVRILFF